MGLLGPIKPKYYINYTAIAPNPDSATTGAVNEIIQCPKTGRLWIQQAASAPYVYQQVLPYVRNNGTPSQVATVMSNSNGTMRIDNEAGSTEGAVNLFDQVTVSDAGIFTPNLPTEAPASFDLVGKNVANELVRIQGVNEGDTPAWDFASQQWVMRPFYDTAYQSLTGDFTVVNANTSTFVTGMSLGVGSGGAGSSYLVTVTCTGYHNGNWSLSAGIEMRDPAPNLGTVVVGASSIEGHGWLTVVVQAAMAPTYSNTTARMVVASTHAGAIIKATPQFNFPATGTYVPDPFPNKSTRISAQRIG